MKYLTIEYIERIYKYLEQYGESKSNDIAIYIGLSSSRTRTLLNMMKKVEALGGNANRTYSIEIKIKNSFHN